MTEDVDSEEARELLEQEWEQVQDENEHEHIDDYLTRTKIKEVLAGKQLTYRYILVTNVLAKAANPSIHYRALQAGSELEGAYNARSLGHDVIVPWDKANGERLGGSNEPFLNQPARNPEWSLDVPARSDSARERLYNLLERLEEKTENGEVDPVDVLRQTLQAYSEIEPRTIEFEAPSQAPYNAIAGAITEYLEESGGGERLAAVTAAVLTAYYEHADSDEWEIDAEHANVPDEFSEAAGDVEIFHNGELVKAVEVKDKPTERGDIRHAITKAQESELEEYLFVVGADFAMRESERSFELVEEAPINLQLVHPDDLLSLLKFVDDAERVLFLNTVGDILNDMRAAEENKKEFMEMVAKIRE